MSNYDNLPVKEAWKQSKSKFIWTMFKTALTPKSEEEKRLEEEEKRLKREKELNAKVEEFMKPMLNENGEIGDMKKVIFVFVKDWILTKEKINKYFKETDEAIDDIYRMLNNVSSDVNDISSDINNLK